MRTGRPSAVAFAVAAGAVLLGAAVSAHHSRAGYDTAKERLTTLNGVVTAVLWRNPHVYITWDANDEKGTVVHWTGEFSSPSTMISEGLSRDTFKAGDPLTVTFMPTKAGTPQGLVIKIARPDGKVVLDLSERRGLLEQ
ncbi:MAG TPA: DUF6152 family protein [Vicinamibacterales bacterium]|nr:DUF6152 family protein [Vicinamibacterales bacterium]